MRAAFLAAALLAAGTGPGAADAEMSLAASGPCAVVPQRDPCAGGACSRLGSALRKRFTPDDVAAAPARSAGAAA
ncbi:MAG: hypothetical protein DCC71_23500, partial [Proteobacteria bacterium]